MLYKLAHDHMPMTFGAPVRKLAKVDPAALVPVPGKPHLFTDAAGRMQYLPPKPAEETKAAAAPAASAPAALAQPLPETTTTNGAIARGWVNAGHEVEWWGTMNQVWYPATPKSCGFGSGFHYRIKPSATPFLTGETTDFDAAVAAQLAGQKLQYLGKCDAWFDVDRDLSRPQIRRHLIDGMVFRPRQEG